MSDCERITVGQTAHQCSIRLAAGPKHTDEKVTYQIVGADEGDIAKGLLSITAPLARALIGKTKGDSVEVSTPGGSKAYEIIRVRYR